MTSRINMYSGHDGSSSPGPCVHESVCRENNTAVLSVNKSALRIPGLMKADTVCPRSFKEQGDNVDAVEMK